MGTLYYGDNLEILREHVKDETAPSSPCPPNPRDRSHALGARGLLPNSSPSIRMERKDVRTTTMATGTLTSKGQTTIPKEIRDGLGLRPKDQIHYTLLPDGTVVMRAKKRSVAELYGALHRQGRRPLSLVKLKR
jgi:antitoxin PrlF